MLIRTVCIVAVCLPLPLLLLLGSGVKQLVSIALGITDTISGANLALSTVFSLLSITFPYYILHTQYQIPGIGNTYHMIYIS